MTTPPPQPSRLTIRDLASRLKLSAMTVSRALRNAPGVSDATQKRVAKAAERLGYRPDPSLAVLSSYRHGKRHLLHQETLAFITNFSTPDEWRQVGTFMRYYSGIEKGASEIGYRVDHFWLGDPGLTGKRASRILINRGVRGLIIGPLGQGGTNLDLDWSAFCVVAVGRSLVRPQMTSVSTNHAQSVELAWQEVWRRGYRRIGFVISEEEELRTLGTLHASFMLQQIKYGVKTPPPLIVRDFDAAILATWVKKHQPEIILTSHVRHYEVLQKTLGIKPSAIALLHLNVEPSLLYSGINQSHNIVGERAVAELHLKLIQRRVGAPEPRDLILIDGTWKEGIGPWKLRAPSNPKDGAPPAT